MTFSRFHIEALVMRVLKDPLTGEMTLEGGALVLADQVPFLRILD